MSFLDRLRGRRGTPDVPDGPSSPNTPGAPDVPDDASPGWDAITAALDAAHPGQPDPAHWAPPLPWSLGGEHPLDGVSIYRVAGTVPHWHVVGYGMSDLYSTETASPGAESGWGVEFTMRLADPAAAEDASAPPTWPISLLQNIARYVVTSGNAIRPGHHVDANGPIQADGDTAMTALLFIRDPQLGRISTPAGEVEFVQIVGATAQDLADATAWSGDGLLSLLAEIDPLLVTDLGRASIRELPGMAERIAQGTTEEGSSTRASMVQRLAVSTREGTAVLTLGASAVPSLHQVLANRLAHGRPAQLISQDGHLDLVPAQQAAAPEISERGLRLTVTDQLARELTEMVRPEAGEYPLENAEAIVVVERSVLRDADGSEVRTIG